MALGWGTIASEGLKLLGARFKKTGKNYVNTHSIAMLAWVHVLTIGTT